MANDNTSLNQFQTKPANMIALCFSPKSLQKKKPRAP